MDNIILSETKYIEDMIFEIRGKQVMLDSDLAKLYHCKNGTKEINQAVRNNLSKFPERFSWVLTDKEVFVLRSKVLTTNYSNMSRVNPRVFTEQGVAMLATILKTKTATEVSIKIMDTFVAMRRYISEDFLIQKYYNKMTIRHDEEIKVLQETLDKMIKKKNNSDIYFSGQIYDAYSKILDIFKEAKEELIVIDGYADKNVLDIIKELSVKVIIITKSDNKLKSTLIEKYNEQYHNLKVIFNNTFHDRYFIIDKSIIYHCGASINRIGYKTFSINLLGDKKVIDDLLCEINKIIKEE